MLKKMLLLAVMALSLVSTVTAAGTQQYPFPPCLPCDGGSGN